MTEPVDVERLNENELHARIVELNSQLRALAAERDAAQQGFDKEARLTTDLVSENSYLQADNAALRESLGEIVAWFDVMRPQFNVGDAWPVDWLARARKVVEP